MNNDQRMIVRFLILILYAFNSIESILSVFQHIQFITIDVLFLSGLVFTSFQPISSYLGGKYIQVVDFIQVVKFVTQHFGHLYIFW